MHSTAPPTHSAPGSGPCPTPAGQRGTSTQTRGACAAKGSTIGRYRRAGREGGKDVSERGQGAAGGAGSAGPARPPRPPLRSPAAGLWGWGWRRARRRPGRCSPTPAGGGMRRSIFKRVREGTRRGRRVGRAAAQRRHQHQHQEHQHQQPRASGVKCSGAMTGAAASPYMSPCCRMCATAGAGGWRGGSRVTVGCDSRAAVALRGQQAQQGPSRGPTRHDTARHSMHSMTQRCTARHSRRSAPA